jgi:DNA polymerase-3 subunit alpha
MPDFTHLHVHTQYSILDGAADIGFLIKKTKDYGMDTIAITDHGNMYGTMEFHEEATRNKIKPIIGIEAYISEGSRFEKKGKEDRSGFHLVLLAKNLTGYKNLCKISSLGFTEGFYYTPRIDKELLAKYSEGLIATTACLGGEVPDTIMHKGEAEAEKVVQDYKAIFGNDFYLELQRHGYEEQKTVNEALVRISAKTGIKLIATNDVHYVNKEDAEAHDILVCLNTGKDFDDDKRMKYSGQEYLKSPEEMSELFKDFPEAIENTREIADKIEVFPIKRENILLPVFPLPDGFENGDEYLKHLAYLGAEKRYPEITDEIRDRLDYELKVIKDMGFAGYFLVVQDFINEARNRGVSVGPGRGSAAGSAVAFCTGITSIDPILYNLLFERFLNPERISMPDIDIDFDDDGRQKVIDYVTEKYGRNKVAQIVTFGTMAAKSSIRDVARVLKLPLQEADRLAKLVPETPGTSLKKAYAEVKELSDAKKSDNLLIRKTLTFAETLEGSIRHTGTHACGVIIGRNDLTEFLPLSTSKDTDLMVTQYEGKFVEYAGMLKMDFLGLKTLSIIKDAIDNIRLRHQTTIDIDTIPLDDKKTFELFQRGDTIGIFQFESDGMRLYMKDLKPTSIEDLIAMNALYRPGPMDFIPTFINRKQGREKTEYLHPLLEGILKPTHGIMVYQEQIMQAAQIMAGFSLGSADLLRRAMGKKKKDIMEQQKEKFIEGAMQKGIEKEKAAEIFTVMEKFAEYGFNRSHSAAYSIVAYQTAYLKANYPAEFMAAILTHNLSDLKKITLNMEECKRLGIKVFGPDVNESYFNFTVNKKGEIRFGLGAVKGVGSASVESIVTERNNGGLYRNIFDLAKRINLRACNKKNLEALAMAGAFDSFGNSHRAQYFYCVGSEETNFIDKIIRHINLVQSRIDAAQHSLFGENDDMKIPDPKLPECEPWSKLDQLKNEKETTGIYISGHPLDDYKIEIDNFCNSTLADLKDIDLLKNKEITVAGIVTKFTEKTTKTGNLFGVFTIEDYNDTYQHNLFSKTYMAFKNYLVPGCFLFLRGRVELRFQSDNQYEFKISQVLQLADVLDTFVKTITVKVALADINEEFISKIFKISKNSKGKCPLKIAIIDPVGNISVEMNSRKFNINPDKFLHAIAQIPEIKFKLN